MAAWYGRVREDELFLSALAIGEIRQGIERLRPHNLAHARTLEHWLEELLESFGDRVLPVDVRVAQNWGRLNSRDTLPIIDSLLAATAQAHGLTLVTRNVKGFEGTAVHCLNPFES